MESFKAFSRKHRIGTVPESVRTHKPSGKDVWDTLVPSMVGVPALTGLYYAGGVPAFAAGLAGAVGLALLDVKRTYSGWALHPLPELPEIKDEEIKEILDQQGRWWGQDIQDALDAHGIAAKVVARDTSSAMVDVYELEVAKGFDIKRLEKLGANFTRDLGLSRGVKFSVDLNIGNGRAGLFLPKQDRQIISLSSVIDAPELKNMRLPVMVGRDLVGKVMAFDLVKSKHTLVGGETGGGKSVQIDNMLCSLGYHCSPDDLAITLIDPKIVELSLFDGLVHIDGDTKEAIVDMEEALYTLDRLQQEMMDRYRIMHKAGARNIEGYNELGMGRFKYHVIVVDEITELVSLTDELEIDGRKVKLGKEAEAHVTKIARLGRAAGFIMIIGAQRFDADVYSGQLRQNITSVIGMRVKKQVYSEMLIEESGCESLLGDGDCYVLVTGSKSPIRAQAAFIDEAGIEAMIKEINQKWSSSII